MKLTLTCGQCLANNETVYDIKPINNTHIYEINCQNGHSSLFIIQNPKFDMLFQSGLESLKAGYYREAVSSFAVALERFYEHCVLILLLDKFPNYPDSNPHFLYDTPEYQEAVIKYEKLWRTPLKLSERQLGAFYGLYFSKYGESPMLFDPAFSKKLGHQIVKDPVK